MLGKTQCLQACWSSARAHHWVRRDCEWEGTLRWLGQPPSKFRRSDPRGGRLQRKNGWEQKCEKERMCTGMMQNLFGDVGVKVMDNAFVRSSAFVMSWNAHACSPMQFTGDNMRWRSHDRYACASNIISPIMSRREETASARLAQPAEHKVLNLVVVGSSPTVGVL